jgi:hypothetical protein
MEKMLIIDSRLGQFMKDRLRDLYPKSFGKLELKTLDDEIEENEKFEFFFISARELCENEKTEALIRKLGRKRAVIFACSSEALYAEQVLKENKAHHAFIKEKLLLFHNPDYETKIKNAIHYYSN